MFIPKRSEVPKESEPKRRLQKLADEAGSILEALKARLEELEAYKIKSVSALADFQEDANKLEKRILNEIGLTNIDLIKLEPETAESSGKKKKPAYVTAKLYTNFESIYYYFKKYEDLCALYENSADAELTQAINKSREKITAALAALAKYKADDQAHEAAWTSDTGQAVVGVAEIEEMRCLAFDDPADSVVDYRMQLKAFIQLLIKKYETALEMCTKSLNDKKTSKILGDDQAAYKATFDNLDPFLKDPDHVKILGELMELNITAILAKVPNALKKSRRIHDISILALPTTLKQYFAFEDNQIPGPKDDSITPERLAAKNGALPVTNIPDKLKRMREVLSGLEKHRGLVPEDMRVKRLFLEVMIEIFQKKLQKSLIEATIFSAIVEIDPKTAMEEWECLERIKGPSELQKGSPRRVFRKRIFDLLEATLDAYLQNPEGKLELPKELGQNVEDLGHVLTKVCLGPEISKLKVQAVRLGVEEDMLETPTASRPASAVMEPRLRTQSEKKPNIRDSIRNSLLLGEGDNPDIAGLSVKTSSRDSFSAHAGSQAKPIPSTPEEQEERRNSVLILVEKIADLRRRKTHSGSSSSSQRKAPTPQPIVEDKTEPHARSGSFSGNEETSSDGFSIRGRSLSLFGKKPERSGTATSTSVSPPKAHPNFLHDLTAAQSKMTSRTGEGGSMTRSRTVEEGLVKSAQDDAANSGHTRSNSTATPPKGRQGTSTKLN